MKAVPQKGKFQNECAFFIFMWKNGSKSAIIIESAYKKCKIGKV